MTAKEYLLQIKKLNILIEQKMSELSELRRYDGYTAVRLGGEGGGKKTYDAAFTRAVEKRVILEQNINSMIDEYIARKNTIISQIHELDEPSHIKVLYKRYIEFKPLYKVSEEMNYSYDRIRHIHGHALRAFYETHLKKRQKDDTP